MIRQLVINIIIAVAWMFLQERLTLHSFILGYLIGYVILYFTVRRLDTPIYTKRIFAAVILLVTYFIEVVRSGIRVTYVILHPKLPVSPGIIKIPLDVTSDEAITMLAGMISMSPGSISIELSEDRKYLYVHALEASDPHKAAEYFKKAFERRIMEVYQ